MAPLLYCLLRTRRLRTRWRRLILLLLVRFLQRVQNAAALRQWRSGRRRTCRLRLRGGSSANDRTRLAIVAGDPGQEQARDKEAYRENRRGARQQIGGAAARHKAGAAADAEAAALGFLQQHRADQRRDDHEVNDDNDSLHLYLPSQTKSAEVRLLIWACGV